MSTKHENEQGSSKDKKVFKRKREDLLLKQQLILGPEAFITERASDEGLDKLSLKIKLIGGREFTLEDYISDHMAVHETKFVKDWFYALADMYGVDRSVMNVYVKPDFVRKFIIQFIYARFPYLLLRELRSRNRKVKGKGKLFQHLKKDISDKLDDIIEQVYDMMKKSESVIDFKMQYSKEYKLHFQVELF